MSKLTLNDVTSGFASAAAVNANNAAIEAAFENTLSRDGSGPNQMEANLDMNGYMVINQANPITISGFNWEGAWATGILYQVGDIIEFDSSSYIAIVEHTSGTFGTDLAALKWQTISSSSGLPSQAGNSGKVLTTNGSSASWTPLVDSNVSFTPTGTGSVASTVQAKLREVVSILDFGATGNGVTNDAAAFQAVLSRPTAGTTLKCIVPAGTYLLNSSPTLGLGNVIFDFEVGATITGAGTIPFNTPIKYHGSHEGGGRNSTVVGGAVKRIVSKLVKEDSIFMISTEAYGGSTILPTDAVLFHSKAVNSSATPRTWTQNTNIVKQSTATDNYSCGIEVSVQNQTTEASNPNTSGCLMGVFASYINNGLGTNNFGSGAFVVGGDGASATTGWNYGLWIDNVKTNGTGITLRNSASNAMLVGLDTRSHTGAFVLGAIGLGNNHRITANDSSSVGRNLMYIDPSNYLQISETIIPVVLNGNGLLLPNIPTSTSASVGAATALPATPAGYISVAIGGVDRKIPYYNS